MKALLLILLTAFLAAVHLTAQQAPDARAVFRAAANYVSLVVTPRDASGQFISSLARDEFRVLEDGVDQRIFDFAVTRGGRFFGDQATSSFDARSTQGLILPRRGPPADAASRVFIIFIDDLHVTPDLTPRLKDILRQIRDTVLHDNDLVGLVSTGYSSIERDPAYDYGHRRFDEAVNKVMGAGPTMSQILTMQQGADGLAELNHQAHVAFRTAHDLLTQMDKMTGLRKAFIWISSGYSLNPLKDDRLKIVQQAYNGEDPFVNPGMQFKEADLLRQIDELTRAANRANVTFFPIDPRGLMAGAGAEMREQLSSSGLRDYQTQTTGTLEVLAHETGGSAAVNTNDVGGFLKTIDHMMSDFYVIGYQSSNADPLRLVRKIEVKLTRPGVTLVAGVDYRDVYTVKRK